MPHKTDVSLAASTHVAHTESTTQEDVVLAKDLRIPTLLLDTQNVSHTMAAALASSLLGHTLFLKSQIPL